MHNVSAHASAGFRDSSNAVAVYWAVLKAGNAALFTGIQRMRVLTCSEPDVGCSVVGSLEALGGHWHVLNTARRCRICRTEQPDGKA